MMTNIRKCFFVLILIVFFALLLSSSAIAKSYHFTKVDIDATVDSKGNLEVTEDRTFTFDGSFSWATYTLRKKGADEISRFTIMENGEKFSETGTEQPGTSVIINEPEKVYAKWFFNALNEERTFTIQYNAVGAVKSYKDIGELYWQFIGDESVEETEYVKITVHLPKGATAKDIRVWGHGPLNGMVKKLDGSTVLYEVKDLPANTFVESRITVPAKIIPNTKMNPVNRLQRILDEEQRWASEANFKRTLSKVGTWASVLLVFVGLIIAFVLWFRFGKEYKVDFQGEYLRELPKDYPPAILGYLWHFGNTTFTDITATLLDLARRKHLVIKELKTESKGLFGTKTGTDYKLKLLKNDKGLSSSEKYLIEFLIKTIGVELTVTFEQIKDYAKSNKQAFISFYKEWQKQVKSEAKPLQLIEDKIFHMATWFIVATVFIFIGFGLMMAGFTTGFITMLPGIGMFASSGLLKRRTKEGALQLKQWKAFKAFLCDFSNLKDAPVLSMIIWEHYLVYAVTLGVADKVIEQLKVVLPQDQQEGYHPHWFVSSQGMQGFAGLSNLDTSLSSLATAGTSSMSSGSGAGGGFSGGGGGGGGGGGVSAG